MKNKYHTVTTVPKPNRKNLRKRQNSYPYQTNLKLIPLSNKYTTAHIPGLVQALQ